MTFLKGLWPLYPLFALLEEKRHRVFISSFIRYLSMQMIKTNKRTTTKFTLLLKIIENQHKTKKTASICTTNKNKTSSKRVKKNFQNFPTRPTMWGAAAEEKKYKPKGIDIKSHYDDYDTFPTSIDAFSKLTDWTVVVSFGVVAAAATVAVAVVLMASQAKFALHALHISHCHCHCHLSRC